MRFCWIRDRVRQGQFLVHWKQGKPNRADCFSKHFPFTHHRSVRSSCLHLPNNSSRNCFQCLEDDDLVSAAKSRSVRFTNQVPKSACSEGVLMSVSPKATWKPEPASQRSPLNSQFTQFTVLTSLPTSIRSLVFFGIVPLSWRRSSVARLRSPPCLPAVALDQKLV